ncbi:MAG: YifB family Mg chelatase-like AAA ATPase [Rikenellaceae bacterium]
MLAKCYGAALSGIDAITITIEVNAALGVQMFIVGLPDNAVKESQHRIYSAFENNGFNLPVRRVTVNMAPANIKKEGSYFDLPIAIGMLAATEQLATTNIGNYLIMGELSLDGTITPIKGALPMAIKAKEEGFKGFILPLENATEAAVVKDLEVYGARNLREVVDFFTEGAEKIEKVEVDLDKIFSDTYTLFDFDFKDVKGQQSTKRALEVAVAGGHNVIMVGAPGSGKTMLARRLTTIMPPMTMEEALETTKIHSVAGKGEIINGLITKRPFRSPHHTISNVALVGGGTNPQPGEISLSHNGILFLDELAEYSRTVLEVMRQPLEDRVVSIARSKYAIEYPANFMLVASMNPCPCGYYGHKEKECTCSVGEIKRYQNRISGPMLDRIDIHVNVKPVAILELSTKVEDGETSEVIRARVMNARKAQNERFKNSDIHSNSMMGSRQVEEFCKLDEKSKLLLHKAIDKLGLSARAYHRILKVSRTIADLDNSEDITFSHISEAIQYRSLDRGN